MKKNDLQELIKKEISSNLKDSKKFFEIREMSRERCEKYISTQTDKDIPGFTDIIDFKMEDIFYSAIEESVRTTINVLSSCGLLQIDD